MITRLQFMRDGEGYLNDVKRHIHVFDIASKKDLQITSDTLRRRRAGVVARRQADRLQRQPHRQPGRQRQRRHLRRRTACGRGTAPLTTYVAGERHVAGVQPGRRSIAYVTGGDSKDIWYATNNVAVVPVAGGTPRILTTGLDRNVSRPQFTPDGASVVFMVEEGGNVHVARAPAAGGAIVLGERVLGLPGDVRVDKELPWKDVPRS